MEGEDERGRPAAEDGPAKSLDNDTLRMRAAPVVTQPPWRRRRHLRLMHAPAPDWDRVPDRYGLTDAELLAERDRLRAQGVPEEEIAAIIVIPSSAASA